MCPTCRDRQSRTHGLVLTCRQWSEFLNFCVANRFVRSKEEFEAQLKSRKIPKGADIPSWIALWIMSKYDA